MGIFDTLFGNKSKKSNPENSRLLELLNIYEKKQGKADSYKNVLLELMNGNSFLLLPSENDNKLTENWSTSKKDTSLNLTCVFILDGLKVLGAFTDEESLLSWAKKPTAYTALESKAVLELCEKELIERIVINSDLPTMFVLERDRENIETLTIEQETKVQVGSPNRPLEKSIIQKLIQNFQRIDVISEVYQYGQTRNDEFSIVLGIKLSTNSENAKTATINAVQNALKDENINQLLELFFIEDKGWYQTIKNIEDSFVYKK